MDLVRGVVGGEQPAAGETGPQPAQGVDQEHGPVGGVSRPPTSSRRCGRRAPAAGGRLSLGCMPHLFDAIAAHQAGWIRRYIRSGHRWVGQARFQLGNPAASLAVIETARGRLTA